MVLNTKIVGSQAMNTKKFKGKIIRIKGPIKLCSIAKLKALGFVVIMA